MKKVMLLWAVLLVSLTSFAQVEDPSWKSALKTKKSEITVMYFENYPFTYKNAEGEMAGIEVEILQDFVKWCQETKGIDISLKFEQSKSFAAFYDKIKTMDNGVVGLGSVSMTNQRKTEVKFTAPYMKNKSILVSQLSVPTARVFDDFEKNFNEMTALVIQGSSHEEELKEIKDLHHPKMRVKYMTTPKELLQQIFEDKSYYGYVDLISYWSFVTERCCVMKIHREVSLKPDYFAFVLPKTSDWVMPFAEFFEGGFGYTATENYRKILEKYLGYEIINSVELY